MPIANYQYTSDAGNLYQISLPSDFPAALGMVVAIGSEPYLDSQITPRTATYVSTTGQIRNTVIGTPRLFGTLPAILNVGGVVFQLSNAIGQQINAFFPANLVSASGPMGPPGANGTFTSEIHYASRSGNQSFGGGGGPYSGNVGVTITLPGTYLLTGVCTVLNNSGAGNDILYAAFIENSNTGAIVAAAECSVHDQNDNTMVLNAQVSCIAGDAFDVHAKQNAATAWALLGTTQLGGYSPCLSLSAIKLS